MPEPTGRQRWYPVRAIVEYLPGIGYTPREDTSENEILDHPDRGSVGPYDVLFTRSL